MLDKKDRICMKKRLNVNIEVDLSFMNFCWEKEVFVKKWSFCKKKIFDRYHVIELSELRYYLLSTVFRNTIGTHWEIMHFFLEKKEIFV